MSAVPFCALRMGSGLKTRADSMNLETSLAKKVLIDRWMSTNSVNDNFSRMQIHEGRIWTETFFSHC